MYIGVVHVYTYLPYLNAGTEFWPDECIWDDDYLKYLPNPHGSCWEGLLGLRTSG